MSNSTKKKKKYILLLLIVTVILLVIIGNISTILKVMYPLKYKEQVIKYSQEYGVDPYLVFSMIKAESNFKEKALSHKNARGLMQITEGTGQWIAQKLKVESFKADDLYNPDLNIRFGCWYLNFLAKEFKNKNNNDLIIMAYNGGSNNVKVWMKENDSDGSGLDYEEIPYKETRNYLKKVKDYNDMYKRLYEKIV